MNRGRVVQDFLYPEEIPLGGTVGGDRENSGDRNVDECTCSDPTPLQQRHCRAPYAVGVGRMPRSSRVIESRMAPASTVTRVRAGPASSYHRRAMAPSRGLSRLCNVSPTGRPPSRPTASCVRRLTVGVSHTNRCGALSRHVR
jgi:hypothetical protein